MIIERPTARILVINPANEILLFKIQHSQKLNHPIYWMTPGGGIETGETAQQAALRELQEETGIARVRIVEKPVWYGEVMSQWEGKTWQLKQHFFIAYISQDHEITMDGLGTVEKELVSEYRWWSLEAINRSHECFIPKQLCHLLRPIIIDQIFPDKPIIIDLSV